MPTAPQPMTSNIRGVQRTLQAKAHGPAISPPEPSHEVLLHILQEPVLPVLCRSRTAIKPTVWCMLIVSLERGFS